MFALLAIHYHIGTELTFQRSIIDDLFYWTNRFTYLCILSIHEIPL